MGGRRDDRARGEAARRSEAFLARRRAGRRGRCRGRRLDGHRRAGVVPARPLPASLRGDRPIPCAELRAPADAAGRGHLHREQVRRGRALRRGRRRPDAAPARDGEGDRRADRGRPLRRLRPRRPGDQRPLRRVVPAEPAQPLRRRVAPRSPPTTRARGTSTSGGARVSGSSSPRPEATWTRSSTSSASTPTPTPTSWSEAPVPRCLALLQPGTCSAERAAPIASRVKRWSNSGSGASKPRARCTAIPSRMTPRNCPISCAETSDRRRCATCPSSIHPRLRSRASGSDRLPALAKLGVGPHSSTELEVDREPVGVVRQQCFENRLEPLIGEDREQTLVVACREREEQLLLRVEPVEDRAA